MTVTLEELARRLDRVESLLAIRNLQHAYGYYLDKTLYSEVVELFSEDCEIVFMGGIYRGRAGAERLYVQRFRQTFTDGRNGPMHGFLLDHPQLQDVVTISEDGDSAKARLRTLMQAGTHYTVKAAGEQRSRRDQWWEGGIYENEYVRVDGVWKIGRLNYQPLWHADFETGWARSEQHFLPTSVAYPENPHGPDELVDTPHRMWPATDVVPFHYPHPVTGAGWEAVTAAPVLIAGEEHAAVYEDVVNPARTDDTVGRYALGGPDDVDAAVRAAGAAFPAWAALTAAERAAHLLRAAEELDASVEERAVLLTRETGKVLGEARVDAAGAGNLLRVFAALAADVDAEEQVDTGIGPAVVRHVPMGPVGVIAPWNTPVLLAFMAIAPALLAGNTVVVKPPEVAPLALSRTLATVALALPTGVVNSVPGRGQDAGAALAAHPRVRKILFTGSIATGRAVMRAAAGNLKSLGMELGGNDAALVLESAEITEELAREFVAGTFSASGQICYNVKRIYVHRSRHAEFVEALTDLASQIVVGDGLDPRTHMGPLATREGFERTRLLREDAEKAGACVATVGVRGDPAGWDRGWFQLPTVVTDIGHGTELVATEQFGPIVPVLAFEDEDEAVRLANDTEYGLAGSVWSADVEHAAAVARRLESGSAFVNVHRVGASPMAVPFGGMKQSGIGRNHGLPSVRACQEPQAVVRVEPAGALPGIRHWSGLTRNS